MTGPAGKGRRGVGLFQRLAMLMLGRKPQLALPPPPESAQPEAPAPEARDEPPPTIILSAEPVESGEASNAEPEASAPPRRRPPDPARRAHYFAAPYVPSSQPVLLLGGPGRAAARGARLVPASPDGLPLAGLSTAPAPATGRSPGLVACIEPIRFSAFAIWHPEAALEVPADATEAWLLEPVLLARAVRLRDAVLHNFAAGGAPLRPAGLFDRALAIAGHGGTALMLCLIVTRAFARGGEAVAWQATDRRSGAFSDGVQTHLPVPRHPEGVVQPNGFDRPSLFYLLFAATALGTADSGDWYRFFALATLAALTASGDCAPPQPLADGPALHLARQVDVAQAALRDRTQADLPAYRAWLWANALSFVEWGQWGRSQQRAQEAARHGAGAARFGLATAGCRIDPSWRWLIPVAGGLRRIGAGPAACIAVSLSSGDGLAA